MTRREAIALGAAAGVTATVGIPAGALATTVGGAGASGPQYLRRSGYVDRVGEPFYVGRHVLTLESVGDVAGAAHREQLRGHEAAFVLTFDGVVDMLPSGLHEVSNDMLGPFPLFLGPVGAPDGLRQTYDAVIDHTVRVKLAPAADETLIVVAPPAPRPMPAGKDAGDAPAPEPTARDLEILEERERAVQVARAVRRRRVRRARRQMRSAYANRMNFVRRQRKARRTIRRRWLARHAP
jgi:hypothetical protein